jgi:hypothetical protein
VVKTVTWLSLFFLLFTIFSQVPTTKAEEPKWAIQTTKERTGTSKLAIKSLAVKADDKYIDFRCESWGNWNLGFDNYRLRVEINIKGEKKPGKKNTYEYIIFQAMPDCEECLFPMLFNEDTGENITVFPFVNYAKDEAVMVFGISKKDINLSDNNFSVSLSVTTKSGGAIDFAPADHTFVLYNPDGPAPDPYFFVNATSIDLGQIQQNQVKTESFLVSNWGSGTFQAEIVSSIPQIQLRTNLISVGDEAGVEVFFTIQPSDLSLGKHKEYITVKALEKEKKVTLLFEILPKPKIATNPKELNFGSLVRTDSSTESLTIKNENPGNLVGTIKASTSWITLSLESFEGNSIDMGVTIANLPRVGLLEGKITVSSNGGNLVIPVTVKSLDIIQLSETEINFGEVDVDKPIKLQKKFKIIHKANDKLTLTLRTDADWIQVFPPIVYFNSYGEESIEIELDFEILRKQLKTYQGSVVIRSDDASWAIPLTVKTIKFEPKLSWLKEESDPVTFDNKIITGKKIQINLVFQNSGTGKLLVEAKLAQSNEWQIDLPSFALMGGEKATVRVSIDTTGLKNKIISNVVQVTSNGGVVSIPLEVHVIDVPTIKIRLWIGKKTAFVNDDPIRLEESPYIQQGSTMVPLRFIGEAFGAKVEWVAEGKGKIIIQLQNHRINLSIGDSLAMIDGKEFMLAVPPEIKNGRTFVPLRFISEGLGAKIDWQPENQEILITLTLTG